MKDKKIDFGLKLKTTKDIVKTGIKLGVLFTILSIIPWNKLGGGSK